MEHAKHMGGFDHAAIPVNDPETMIRFYGALGFGVPDLVRDAAPVTGRAAGWLRAGASLTARAACRVLTGHLYLAQEVFRREKPPSFHVQFGPNKINMHRSLGE